MTRVAVLGEVALRVCARDPGHPLLVGIDGPPGSGKTTFSSELAESIEALGRPAVNVDSDGFHHLRRIRHRQGRSSARGYYEDAYDFDALRDFVLLPLGTGGSCRFASRVHDLETDEVLRDWAVAPVNAVVLFAATFLQRDAVRDHWDEVIYLDSDLDLAKARGVARDAAALGGHESAVTAYESRYMAAWQMYAAEQRPRERASIVVNHDDPLHPLIQRRDAP